MELQDTITQEEMVYKSKRGDPSGYTELYHRYAKEIYNTIYRLVNHTAEAEDLLQESFVAAFQAIGSFENTGGFRAWIKRIAINKSISWLRKRKNQVWTEFDAGILITETEETLDEIAFTTKVSDVINAIEKLPYQYRTIVQLYLLENIPQAEIANMVGLTHNTVRVQYHRAKQQILKTLEKKDRNER